VYVRILKLLGLYGEKTLHGTLSLDAKHSMGDLLLVSWLIVVGVSNFIFGIVSGDENLTCFDRAIVTLNIIISSEISRQNWHPELNLKTHMKTAIENKPGWILAFSNVILLTAAKLSSVVYKLRNVPVRNSYSAST
jgi:hypothetical protein